MKEAHGVRVSLKPSRAASILVGASCVGSAALVAWLPGDPALRAAIVAALAIYAIATVRRWALRSTSHAIVGIEVDLDCRVCLVERNGARIEGFLWPDSYVSAWLTTVVVRLDGRRRVRSTAIVPDMLPAEDFRRLRLVLRLARADATLASTKRAAPAASAGHR